MSQIYVKRGCVVEAEPFDPARTDQGVNIVFNTAQDAQPGDILCATMTSRGRLTNVRTGDYLITDAAGSYPISEPSFVAMYQLLSEIVVPSLDAAPALIAPAANAPALAAPETVPALVPVGGVS